MPKFDNRFDINSFLNKLAQIESSGGKDFSHREIASGLHEGDRAIGRYGLMPNTVQEINRREIAGGKIDPEMVSAAQLPHDEMKRYLEANPDLEQRFAQAYAQHLRDKFPGDEERMAYGWTMGPSRPSPSATQLDQSDYVNKFRRINEMMKNRQLLENAQEKPLESRMGDVKMADEDEED